MIQVETEITSKEIVAGMLADADKFAVLMSDLNSQATPEFFEKMAEFADTYEADSIKEFFGNLTEAMAK